MAANRARVEEVFVEAAMKADMALRYAYLDEACGQDGDFRARVDALLAAHDAAGDYLKLPEEATGLSAPTSEKPGDMIGHYKLLEQIGEGGFAVVFMAEQQRPVRRRVALKIIKLGMDTRQVVSHFEAERQALAMMDHPGIAKVFDAGATETGRPYFVMELFKGKPITEYCDEHKLTTRRRLSLITQVCQAVQHAHQKGIIHRDLKPTNVLVSTQDDRPLAKVIDFGIAKATQSPLTEKTLFANFRQLIGTPSYMSPEQADGGLDIDTRSDVYSLGVILYELLTGSPPFDPKELCNKSISELQRVIREVEPPQPSTKISSSTNLATMAANHGAVPAQLGRQVQGDLDWIVMKCLEKDRCRRYQSASGLETDLRHFLADEPVAARPPSRAYLLRKFVQRNRGPVLAACLVLFALVGGIIGTTWGLIRSRQAREIAESAQRAEAERAKGERRAKEEVQKRLSQIENGTEILASVFRDLDPNAAESDGVTQRDLLARRLDKASRLLEGEALGDPLVVARLQHALGISLRELGHLEQAERVLLNAYRTREQRLGSDHLDTAATKHDLALLYRDQGKYDLAKTLQERVVAIRAAKLGAEHLDTLTSQHNLAVFYQNLGKYPEAETLFKQVLAARTTKEGADHPDTLTTQHRLALLYRNQGKYELAEALYKEVLALRTARLGPDHLHTVATKDNLAALKLAQGQTDVSEELCKDVLAVRTAKLGPNHPDTLASQHRLALLYMAQGKSDLAETLVKEVVMSRTAKLGADHPDTLRSLSDLAVLYLRQEKYALAEMQYKEILAIQSMKLGANHPDTLSSQSGLAVVYRCMKKPEQAIPLLEEAIKRSRANNSPLTMGMQAELGAIYCDAGRFADAITQLEEVQAKSREDPELAWIGNALLTAYVGVGKKAAVVALALQQARVAREHLPADSLELAVALAPPGQALMEVQEYADAEPLLLANYEGLAQNEVQIPHEAKDVWLRDAAARLVQLYDLWGQPDEAGRWRMRLEQRATDSDGSPSTWQSGRSPSMVRKGDRVGGQKPAKQ